MRLLRLGLIVLLVCGIAGCGSSTNASSSGGAVATVTKTVSGGGSGSTSASTTTTASSSATTTSTTATSSGPPPCRAAGLALTYLGGQGATGHGELGFALRNTGSASCATVGYPGIQFLDRGGGALPTNPMHTTHDFFGAAPEAALVVKPGASVSFRLGVTHGAESTKGCTTAYGLQAIAPNDTATLRVTIPNGAYECVTATVSPLQAGDAAYQ